MMGKLFQNPSKAVIGIVVFIVALVALFLIAKRGNADEPSRQVLYIEAGSAMLRGETPTLGFTIACKLCGPVNTDYEYGFELIGTSSHYQDNPNVIQLHAQIVDGWKNVELGLGFYWQNVQTEYVCKEGFHLLARYRFTDRMALQWRHSSSGGSCKPNAGRDLLTVGFRF